MAFEKEPRLRKDSVLFVREVSRMMEENQDSKTVDDAFVTLRRLCTSCIAFSRVLAEEDSFLAHLQIFYEDCNRDKTKSLILALVRVAITSNPRSKESLDKDSKLFKMYRKMFDFKDMTRKDNDASSSSSPSSWSCSVCTFINKIKNHKCEMCETPCPIVQHNNNNNNNNTNETLPVNSWIGKRPMIDHQNNNFKKKEEEEEENMELTQRILSVYNAYDDDGGEEDVMFEAGFSVDTPTNANHGDYAKTQTESILRDAEERERASLIAEAPNKIIALQKELDRLGPKDRDAIKSIRKRIERWKSYCTSSSNIVTDVSSTKNTTSTKKKKVVTLQNGKHSRRKHARKNRNKASVGNHNRKKNAAKKRR